MTLQEIKDQALQLVLYYGSGGAIREKAVRLKEEYLRLSCRYQVGDTVWYLDGFTPIACEVTAAYCNDAGYAFYIIRERTGRTVNFNNSVPEHLLFPNRESLVKKLRDIK